MVTQQLTKLSDGQKDCLRLVIEGFEAKEIARKLLISPHTVVERLRVARRLLDVQTSWEAARILAREEGRTPYNWIADNPIGVESTDELQTLVSSETTMDMASEENNTLHLREMQMPFTVTSPHKAWNIPLPIPTSGRPTNDLNLIQTILMVLVLAVLLGFACISAISIVSEISDLLAK